jgi:hypothetical protein
MRRRAMDSDGEDVLASSRILRWMGCRATTERLTLYVLILLLSGGLFAMLSYMLFRMVDAGVDRR